MRNFILLALLTVVARPLFAVSMNFTGNLRTDVDYYNGLDLNLYQMAPKTFIQSRFLLNPVLVIDDHFSIHSQWNLLTSPTFTPDATNPLGIGQGGYIFGDTSTNNLILTRAWLEWTSDFGVLRLGRMPVSWGYGLVYDAGDEVWDNWKTDMDRIEYRLHLGHIIGAVAYSKPRKLSTIGQQNDQDFYTIYLQYDNPEMEMQGGVLYEKQVRSGGSIDELTSGSTFNGGPSPNPFALPSNATNPYPLANQTASPLSNNLVDLYLKKTTGGLTFGGEVSWISGAAAPVGDLNAFAVNFNTAYEVHSVKAFLDFLYASGDTNFGGGHLNGFTILNRNRSPGLILGHELLGPYASSLVAYGSPLVYGDAGTFSGVYYFRPGFRVEWSTAWSTGLEAIIARKASVTSTDFASLGVEFDANVTHSVYKNFDIGLDIGFLAPGLGLRVPNPRGVFGTRGTVSMKF